MASSSSSPAPAAPGSATTSKIFLFVAILLGVLATVLAFIFIQQAGEGKTGTGADIVVAKRDMAPNSVLDPERDLQVEKVPLQFSKLAVKCLDYKSLSLYKGQRINRAILQGQPVFLGDIANVSVGDITWDNPNLRALPITLKNIGMVIPGDYVKIILPGRPGISATASEPALPPGDAQIIGRDPGFRVLAVRGSSYLTRQQALAFDQSSTGSSSQSVTLQVTEAQAREIVNALGTASYSNGYLMICPSPLTASPSDPSDVTPATSRPVRP